MLFGSGRYSSFRIVYYFACKSLESSIRQALCLFFPLPTKGERRSWLIQKCLSKSQCQLQGILRTSWIELKSRANENRADELTAKGCEKQQWERTELQKGTRKEVLCLFTAFLLPCMTLILLYKSNISHSSRFLSDLVSFRKSCYNPSP